MNDRPSSPPRTTRPASGPVGGTYAEEDYSPGARRSTFQDRERANPHTEGPPEQFRKSGFEKAEGQDGPAGPGSQ